MTWNLRTKPTSTWSGRPWITFITTEIFDFLMTEDDRYLITDESIFNIYTSRDKPTSTWNWRIIPN